LIPRWVAYLDIEDHIRAHFYTSSNSPEQPGYSQSACASTRTEAELDEWRGNREYAAGDSGHLVPIRQRPGANTATLTYPAKWQKIC
jgi:hypothetical protein